MNFMVFDCDRRISCVFGLKLLFSEVSAAQPSVLLLPIILRSDDMLYASTPPHVRSIDAMPKLCIVLRSTNNSNKMYLLMTVLLA